MQQACKFVIFLHSQDKQWLVFLVNRLLADDSQEKSSIALSKEKLLYFLNDICYNLDSVFSFIRLIEVFPEETLPCFAETTSTEFIYITVCVRKL